MNDLVLAARERLVTRARRDGLETVGYRVVDSPLGPLWIAVGPQGVLAIHYGAEPDEGDLRRIVAPYGPALLPHPRPGLPVARELDQYFAGRRRTFDVPVDLSPLTEFQRRILRATARVAFGEVSTYAGVAARAGSVKAFRAAGQALTANPVPIVVPCHRVVASDGSLGGYAGGLAAKRRLLSLERGEAPAGGWEKKSTMRS